MEQPQILGLTLFWIQYLILDLLKYFILTWIGPNYVMQHPHIDPGQEDLNYGANVDAWIRDWILHDNLHDRMALFPIPV